MGGATALQTTQAVATDAVPPSAAILTGKLPKQRNHGNSRVRGEVDEACPGPDGYQVLCPSAMSTTRRTRQSSGPPHLKKPLI